MNTFTLFIILFWNSKFMKGLNIIRIKIVYKLHKGDYIYNIREKSIWNYMWKRKRSDSVLWQKPLQPQKNPKSNVTTYKHHQKLRLHNYCGTT